MRLLRVGAPGTEVPVVLDDGGHARDLRPVTSEINGDFLAGGGVARVRDALAGLPELDVTGMRIGAPVARPGALVCIGLNYSDHAAETAAEPPSEPVVFMKNTNTVIWYLSQFMVLEPGDVVNTGTPAGVALGVNDFDYLREGDSVEVAIDRLGVQRHRVGQA